MVCTFSGWVEAFPTWTEKANEVAHRLLWEIIPRFGFPTRIGSDNGPAFVADLILQVCKALNIKWKLHSAYRSQSSGTVERTNWTLKRDALQVDRRDWLLPGGLPSDGSAQTQDDPMVPRLFSEWNCVWEAPSHNKTDVNKFASGERRWDFTADGTTR